MGGSPADRSVSSPEAAGRKFSLSRDVTRTECPWLRRDLQAGETVFHYTGPTYGCVADGVAVTEKSGEHPFFEVPRDALTVNSACARSKSEPPND